MGGALLQHTMRGYNQTLQRDVQCSMKHGQVMLTPRCLWPSMRPGSSRSSNSSRGSGGIVNKRHRHASMGASVQGLFLDKAVCLQHTHTWMGNGRMQYP